MSNVHLWRPKPGGQSAFWRDWRHRYVALEGGWAAGKTYAGARKLIMLHLYNAQDDEGRPTRVRSAVVAPTFANFRQYDLPALLEACDEIKLKCRWRPSENEIAFPGHPIGSLIACTADAPDRITGFEIGAFWGDEAARWKSDEHNPTNDPLTQIKGRLRHPKARKLQGFYTYTNEGDGTAIFKEFAKGGPDHAIYRGFTKDNDTVSTFYQDMLRQLPPELAEQYLNGGAISLRGANIYPCFDRDRNMDSSLELHEGIPLHLSVDFNINPGMHVELGQELPQGLTCVHEIHEKGMSVRDVGPALRKILDSYGGPMNGSILRWPELHVFGDASGNARWSGTGETNYDMLRLVLDGLGIPYRLRVPEGNPPVVDRFNAFNAALYGLDGSVGWKCHPRCERLIDDLLHMKRDKNGEVDKKDADLSHASDAEGYRVHRIRPIRRPKIRPEDQIVSV